MLLTINDCSYRITASVIEVLLYEENVPRHRVLTVLVTHVTGFAPTDAKDLEEVEPFISHVLIGKIGSYGRITSAKCLFNQNNGPCYISLLVSGLTLQPIADGLVQQLLDIVMRWTIGNEPTICIKDNMHEIIAQGIGFLDEHSCTQVFNPAISYPVYISEPLVILNLMSTFQTYSHVTRKRWLANAFCTARNSSSRGYVLEEVALCVLVDAFGSRVTELGKVFHCDPSLRSRKVSLVSLTPTLDGKLQTFPVSWTSGTSDRFGFKAQSPNELLNFLDNPRGRAFAFPDIHMGPDLLCFLQDEETKELILVALQAKVSKRLDTNSWLSALSSVNPKLFYSAVVCINRLEVI